MVKPFDPFGDDPPIHNPPKPGGGGTSKANVGGSPGLLTSTGGLQGFPSVLMVPVFDPKTGLSSIYTYEDGNFNTPDECIHFFRQEDIIIGRSATVTNLIVVYRDIGKFTATFSVTVYLRESDTYEVETKTIKMGKTNPDFKLHTTKVNIIITGERPQVSFTSPKKSGPLSIISVTMCGKMDEEAQL